MRIAAFAVSAAAAFIGLFTRRDGSILLISCQADTPTPDMTGLAAALEALPDAPKVVVMAGLMRRSLSGAFAFVGIFFSMLRRIATAGTVVLDAYCPAVSIPKKRPNQKVVQLWHSPEAIKKFSLQIVDTSAGYSAVTAAILKMHRGYDFILCPSAATLPFFAEAFGYPKSAFVKYGLPELDIIGLMRRPARGETETPERAAARERIFARYPALARSLVAVYAPTFRDGEAVGAAGLERAFRQAFAGNVSALSFVTKPHPLDALKNGVSGMSEQSGCSAAAPCVDGADAAPRRGIDHETAGAFCAIPDTEFPLIEWYAVADVIITDYSGVAVTAAAAGIASYYYIYDADAYAEKRGVNVDLRKESVGRYAFAAADALAARVFADFSACDGRAGESDGGSNDSGTEEPGDRLNGGGMAGYTGGYDYAALAAFASKYLEVPLSGNTQRLAAFVASL